MYLWLNVIPTHNVTSFHDYYVYYSWLQERVVEAANNGLLLPFPTMF